jgi:preprotein translocase subunit SecE
MVVVLTVLVLALFFFIIDQGILQLVRLITK